MKMDTLMGNEFGKRFDYNEWMMGYKINLITKKTSLISNNEQTKTINKIMMRLGGANVIKTAAT